MATYSEWRKKQNAADKKAYEKEARATIKLAKQGKKKKEEYTDLGLNDLAYRAERLRETTGNKSRTTREALSLLKKAVSADKDYREASKKITTTRGRATTPSFSASNEKPANPFEAQRQGMTQIANARFQAKADDYRKAQQEEENKRRASLYKYGDVDNMSSKELGDRIKKLEAEKKQRADIRNQDTAVKGYNSSGSGAGGGQISALLNNKGLSRSQLETMDKLDADADDKLSVYRNALVNATIRDEEKKLTGNDKIRLQKAADQIRHLDSVQDENGNWKPAINPDMITERNNKVRASVEDLKKRGIDTDYLIEAYGTQMDNEDAERTAKDLKEWAGDNWFNGLLASVGTVVASPITGLLDAPADIYHAVRNSGTDKPIPVNEKYRLAGNLSQSAREGVSENIENPVWNFIYNAGMSTADSAMAIATGAALGGASIGTKATQAIMSINAADQTYDEAVKRGLDPMNALTTAITAGVTEWVTEKYSIDGFKKMAMNRPDKLRTLVTNIGKQMATEGSEEAASDVLNTIADNVINGKKSEYNQNVKRYLDQGLTQQQAKKAAMMDWLSNTAYDAAAGAFSGALMGAGGQAMSFNQVQNDIEKYGGNIKKGGDLKAVIDYAAKFEGLEKLAKKADKTANDSKTVGKIAEAVEKKVNERVAEAETAEELGQIYEELRDEAPDTIGIQIDAAVREKAAELSKEAVEEDKEALDNLKGIAEESLMNASERMGRKIEESENETEMEMVYDENTGRTYEVQPEVTTQGMGMGEEIHPQTEKEQKESNERVSEEAKAPLKILNHRTATLDASGERVTIEGIEGTGTKDVRLKIDGHTDEVPLSDVHFESRAVEQIYRIASTMDDSAAATAMISNYDGKQDTRNYALDFDRAYNWGSAMMSYDSLRQKFAFSTPEHIVKMAYYLGQNAAEKSFDEAHIESQEIKEGKKTFKKGTGKAIDERTDEYAKGDIYSNIDKAMAKKIGITVRSVDDIKSDEKEVVGTINGYFDATNAEMRFSEMAESKLGVRIHESMEFLEKMDPDLYKMTVGAVLKFAMDSNGAKSIYDEIINYRDTYRDVEGKKTFAEATEEYINDAISGAFMSEEGAKDFINWLGKENFTTDEKKGILKTIADIINGLIEKIKDALNMGGLTKAQQKIANTSLERQQMIRQLFTQAMDSAINNYQGTAAGETQTESKAASVARSIKSKPEDIKRDFLERYEGKEGRVTTEEGYDKEKYETEVKAATVMARAGMSLTLLNEKQGQKNPDSMAEDGKFWEIKGPSTYGTIDKKTQYALKQIEKNPGGIILYVKNRNLDIERIENIVEKRIGYSARRDTTVVIVQNDEIASVKNYKHKKIEASPSPTGQGLTSKNNLSRLEKNVNTFGKSGEKISRSVKVDSRGHELSEEQIDFFKDSKIRDKEGRLRVVYHGTNNTEFNIFDTRQIGTASGDTGFFGKGFYFAYSRGEASYYGSKRIIPAYINVKNPFNFETELGEYNGESSKYGGHASDAVRLLNLAEKFPDLAKGVTVSVAKQGSNDIVGVSIDDFAKEFKNVIENKKFTFRTEKNQRGDEVTIAEADPKEIEYEYDGEKQTEKYYEFEESFFGKPSPIDVAYAYLSKSVYSFINMQDFTKTVVLDNSEAFTNTLKEKGYDGTIQSEDGDEVVAFYPEQIKSVDNENPTKDVDIRYSLSDTKETVDLLKENKDLREMVDNLKKEFELTGGTMPDQKKIKSAARKILKKYSSEFDLDTLTENITNVYSYLRQDGADFDEAVRVMSEIARGVLERTEIKDDTMSKQYEDLKKQIKAGVNFTDLQREELSHAGGITAFTHRSGIRSSKQTIDLDRQWAEWSTLYPELFPADTNEGDMPFVLEGILEAISPQIETLNGETIDQMAYDVAMQIYSEIAKVPVKETFADKKEREKYEALQHVAETYEDLVEAYRKNNTAQNEEDLKETLEQVKKERTQRIARLIDEVNDLNTAKKYAGNPKTLEQYKKEIEKKGAQIAHLKAQNDEKIAELRQKYQGQRAKQVETRRQTEQKDKIRRLHEKFRRMILKPTETMHVPAELMQSAIEVCEVVNLGAKKGTKLFDALYDAERAFGRIKSDTETYGIDDFDPRIAGDLARLTDLFHEKGDDWSIYDMTSKELEQVYDAMSEIYESIRLSTKLIREEGEKDVRRAGKKVIKELQQSKGVKDHWWSRAANRVSSSFLNSQREFRRLSGYNDESEIMDMWRELNEGQRRQYQIQMEGENFIQQATLAEGMEDLMKEIDSDKALVKVPLRFEKGTAPVMVTKGMRLAIILHGMSTANRLHMMEGGMMIPDMSKYQSDKKRAYEKSRKVVGITSAALMQMEAELSTKERTLLNTFADFFHNWTGDLINKTSMDLYGFKKARVENYYPIYVDQDFVATDISALKFDKTIEGAGFLKERVRSTNPIILESVIDTADRSLNAVSLFSGLAIPIRNFNKIMNVSTYKATEGDSEAFGGKGWTVDTSVKKEIEEIWGSRTQKYIDDMLSDLQQARRSEASLYDKLRGNYAGAVLTANASVIIKQTSAYPMCAAITGWSPTLKAMFRGGKNNWILSKADQELINEYTPIYWERNKGNSTRELAEIREYGTGITKLPPVRLVKDAIQKVDMAMVGRFWYAAQYYINSTQKELAKKFKADPNNKRIRDQYYSEVAKVFDRCVGETQSTNMVLQNADIMRNTNVGTKIVTMFMGQGLQNFGVVYDSINNLRAKRAQYKNGTIEKSVYTQAKKDVANALSSQFVSAAVFAGLAIVARALLHRMNPYRDDKEEITGETILSKWWDDLLDNIIGSVPLGSFTYEWASAVIDAANGNGWVRPYGQNDIVLQSLSDLESSTVNLFKAISKGEGIAEAINEVAKDGSKLFGVPWENVSNLFEGTMKHIQDVTEGKGPLSFTSDQKNPAAAKVIAYLTEAIKQKDAQSIEKYTELLYDIGKNAKDINTLLAKPMKEEKEVKAAATAKENGDLETYQKAVDNFEKKGYPKDAIIKAINDIIKNKNKEKEEKPDPEVTKERARSLAGSLYGSVRLSEEKIFKAKDLQAAVETGKGIDAVVKELLKEKLDTGLEKEEAVKKVATNIKTALKGYKEEYLDGNAHERTQIIKKLQKIKVDGNIIYDQDLFLRWNKEADKQKK